MQYQYVIVNNTKLSPHYKHKALIHQKHITRGLQYITYQNHYDRHHETAVIT